MNKFSSGCILFLWLIGLNACGYSQQTEVGKATYYAHKFAGHKTASGEIYQPSKFTAAHREIPFGTHVKVVNLATNKAVVVEVNDRGPYSKGRIIDLSYAAAKYIGLIKKGVLKVKIIVVKSSVPLGPSN